VQVDGMLAVGGLYVRKCEARGQGLDQKIQNQVFVARFWGCHVKRQCGEMTGVVVIPPTAT